MVLSLSELTRNKRDIILFYYAMGKVGLDFEVTIKLRGEAWHRLQVNEVWFIADLGLKLTFEIRDESSKFIPPLVNQLVEQGKAKLVVC